ncbi:MAG: winged helix-turn-helix domain-containing protein [Oscillospiraceae bacterium]|nr:winged helix-turn-helix domain-containing protein [Oscillospiraceae bacterium]
MDISESGQQIGEKLFALLDNEQRRELTQYVLVQKQGCNPDIPLHNFPACIPPITANTRLTEVQAENLYFCLENRIVYVCETEIALTVKEFDIFALLIMNPHRVLTYDMIMNLVWHENLDYYSRRAINNHVSNLRRKLKRTPDYIRSVHSIGYKFNPNIKFL